MKSFKIFSVVALLSLTGSACAMFGRRALVQVASVTSQQPARSMGSLGRLFFGQNYGRTFPEYSAEVQGDILGRAREADKNWEELKNEEYLKKAEGLHDRVTVYDILRTVPSKTGLAADDCYNCKDARHDERIKNLFNETARHTMFKTLRDRIGTRGEFNRLVKNSVNKLDLHHGDNLNRYNEGSVTLRVDSNKMPMSAFKAYSVWRTDFLGKHNALDREQAQATKPVK